MGSELVVDSWTGATDRASMRPVDGQTLFPVFSVSKAITAVALHIQVERGLVRYEAPICEYRPEFMSMGKEDITVHHVLTHRSGLPQMPPDVTPELMCDWEWVIQELSKLTPLFPAGQRSAYQSLSFGWLVGEVVRRTDPLNRDFRTFVHEEIARPLGITDLWLGIPAEDEGRVAHLEANYGRRTGGDLSFAIVPLAVTLLPPVHNRADIHHACLPATGGIMNARSVARFFAMLANRGKLGETRLLSEERVQTFSVLRERSDEIDALTGSALRIGIGGLWTGGPHPPAEPIVGENPRIVCHPGAGGTIAWADPDIGLAVAICHNRMYDRATMSSSENPFVPLGDVIRKVASLATRTKG